MHVDQKTFTLLPSVETCAFHLIYHLHMVTGLKLQARLNLSTLNYAKAFSVISVMSLNLMMIMMMMMRRRKRRFMFNDKSIHESHLHQNSILTLIGNEMA